MLREQVQLLTEDLFSLEEPWQGRFLAWVADRAAGVAGSGRLPTREEMATWLGDDDLYQETMQLLYAWQRV